jgi:glycosyltransferase involved in cell wall biosynthesis
MLMYSPFEYDARVLKEIRTLVSAGHTVRLIALGRRGLPLEEEVEGARIRRVEDIGRGVKLFRWFRRLRGRDGLPLLRGPVQTPGESALARGIRSVSERVLALIVDTVYWRRWARRARREAIDEGADVWYAHDLDSLPPAASARRRRGGALIYDSHELFLDQAADVPKTKLENWWWQRQESRLVHECDHVITDIDSRAEILASRYGIPKPTSVMNVPPYARAPSAHGGAIRAPLGLGRERIVLYLGGMSRGRLPGLAMVVRALPAFPDDSVLVLLGHSAPGVVEELRSLAGDLGVAERLFDLPPVHPDRIRDFAADADIGLIPFLNVGLNHYYSLPTKLFDYLGAGLPVAGSDFPDIRSVIDGFKAGSCFDTSDPASIAAAIRRVLDDPQYEQIRANAVEAGSRFRWETEAEKLLAAVEAPAALHS